MTLLTLCQKTRVLGGRPVLHNFYNKPLLVFSENNVLFGPFLNRPTDEVLATNGTLQISLYDICKNHSINSAICSREKF